MDTTQVSTERAQLKKSIADWVVFSGATLTKDAKDFMQALDGSDSLARWAGADMSRVFPFRPSTGGAALAYTVRSALIFLPVLFTWLSLAHAAKGFLSASEDSAQVNFILYWQALPGFQSLSSVAYFDVILIGAVVVVSLYISIAIESPSRIFDLQQRHDAVLSALESQLSVYRVSSSESLHELSQSTYENLRAASQQVSEAAVALSTVASGSLETIVRLEAIVTRDFLPIAARVDAVVRNLEIAAGTHGDLATSVGESQARIVSAFNALDAALKQTSGELRDSLSEHRGGVRDAIVEGGREFGRRLSEQLGQTASTVNEADKNIRDQLVKLKAIVDTVGSQSENLTESVVTRIEGAVGRVHGVSEQVAESLQAIARSLETTVLQVRNDLEKMRSASGRA